MRARRILLWVFPILIVSSFALLNLLSSSLTRQEAEFQGVRAKSWTTYLQEYKLGLFSGSPGMRDGEVLLDKKDRVWVAGSPTGLGGVHLADEGKWNNFDGEFSDFALDPQGRVWMAGNSSAIAVTDMAGQNLTWYDNGDLGIGNQMVKQIEIDSLGRVWAVIENFGVEQVAEFSSQGNMINALMHNPEFTITRGQIKSLDADNKGRIWAAVWDYTGNSTQGDWTGLNVFNGKIWQRVQGGSVDLQHIVRTRFDDQGRVWVVTECGSVMNYDGQNWVTVVKAETPPCRAGNWIMDFTLDNQGRVWAWETSKLKFLIGSEWISLTSENSGLIKNAKVFGMTVDKLNQAWIGTSEGVLMTSVENLQPLSLGMVQNYQLRLYLLRLLEGTDWFLASIFAMLWLAVALKMLPGVLLASVLGVIAMVFFTPISVDNHLYFFDPRFPVMAATYFGVIGGLLGGLLDHLRAKSGSSKKQWNYKLAAIGLVTGYLLTLFFLAAISP